MYLSNMCVCVHIHLCMYPQLRFREELRLKRNSHDYNHLNGEKNRYEDVIDPDWWKILPQGYFIA